MLTYQNLKQLFCCSTSSDIPALCQVSFQNKNMQTQLSLELIEDSALRYKIKETRLHSNIPYSKTSYSGEQLTKPTREYFIREDTDNSELKQ